MSVQGLIDFLRTIQDQGPLPQMGLVILVVVAAILIIAWVKRVFHRSYQDIKDENVKLTAHLEAAEETRNKIRRENAILQKEIETIQARLPEAVLNLVDLEIRDGNYEIAFPKLQRMFDDLSPGLKDCFLRLSEWNYVSDADDTECGNIANAKRYSRLADLLQAVEKEAKPS